MALRVISSGVKTSDIAIKSSEGAVYWVTVSDTSAGVAQLANDTETGGTVLWQVTIPDDGYIHVIFCPALQFSTGIFLDVPTGAPDIVVGYL